MRVLVAYDRERVLSWVRERSPQWLLTALDAPADDPMADPIFATSLHDREREILVDLLREWEQRALGIVTLRDAMWVDPLRGEQVFTYLCQLMTVERLPLSEDISASTVQQMVQQAAHGRGGASSTEGDGVDRGATRAHDQPNTQFNAIKTLVSRAETDGLDIVYYEQTTPHYPLPANLEELTPPDPLPPDESIEQCGYPTVWQYKIMVVLILLGIIILSFLLVFFWLS